jgi:hypothetical protein
VPADLRPAWSRSDLKRTGPLLSAIAAFVITAPMATVIACNFHEIGHGAVATILGWEVERIDLCLPTGGRVVYAHVGTWAGNAQGYAGGLIAAAALVGVYLLAFHRKARPSRGPGWWFAGLGLVLPVGPQVVNGVLEGAVGQGEDYTQQYASLLPPLVVIAMAAGAIWYAWRWRVVWRSANARH